MGKMKHRKEVVISSEERFGGGGMGGGAAIPLGLARKQEHLPVL